MSRKSGAGDVSGSYQPHSCGVAEDHSQKVCLHSHMMDGYKIAWREQHTRRVISAQHRMGSCCSFSTGVPADKTVGELCRREIREMIFAEDSHHRKVSGQVCGQVSGLRRHKEIVERTGPMQRGQGQPS